MRNYKDPPNNVNKDPETHRKETKINNENFLFLLKLHKNISFPTKCRVVALPHRPY